MSANSLGTVVLQEDEIIAPITSVTLEAGEFVIRAQGKLNRRTRLRLDQTCRVHSPDGTVVISGMCHLAHDRGDFVDLTLKFWPDPALTYER